MNAEYPTEPAWTRIPIKSSIQGKNNRQHTACTNKYRSITTRAITTIPMSFLLVTEIQDCCILLLNSHFWLTHGEWRSLQNGKWTPLIYRFSVLSDMFNSRPLNSDGAGLPIEIHLRFSDLFQRHHVVRKRRGSDCDTSVIRSRSWNTTSWRSLPVDKVYLDLWHTHVVVGHCLTDSQQLRLLTTPNSNVGSVTVT